MPNTKGVQFEKLGGRKVFTVTGDSGAQVPLVDAVITAEKKRFVVPRLHAGTQTIDVPDTQGIRDGAGAKFVRRYADLQDAMSQGVANYAADVRSGAFPAPEHGYGMDPAELAIYQARRGEIATVADDLAQLLR